MYFMTYLISEKDDELQDEELKTDVVLEKEKTGKTLHTCYFYLQLIPFLLVEVIRRGKPKTMFQHHTNIAGFGKPKVIFLSKMWIV